MPVNAAELMVKIGGDTSDLTSKVNEADGTLNKLGGTLGTVAKVGLGGMVVAAGGLVAGIGTSIGKAQDFEAALSGIQAVSGATSTEMQTVADKALQIGKDTSFSATEGAAAIEELVKAGVSIPDIMNGAADATVALAAATGIKVPEAATIASNAMNQFHLAAKDLPGVVDQIAGAANASAIDVSQFGFSLSAVGAVANTIGFDFKDTATAIAELGNAGIVGSDAGTSLKTMFLNLSPSTKQATAEFRALGIIGYDNKKLMDELARHGLQPVSDKTDELVNQLDRYIFTETQRQHLTGKAADQFREEVLGAGQMSNAFFDANGKVKSLAEVSQVLQDALKGLTQEQKVNALQTMFGTDAVRAAAILADNGADGFNKLAQAMGAVSASDVATTRLQNTRGSMEALKGSLETLQITIGRAFLPMIKSGVDGSIQLVNALIPLAEKAAPMLASAITAAHAAISGFITQGVAIAMPYLVRFGQWFQTDGIERLKRFNGQIQDTFRAALPYIQQFAQAFVVNVVPALVRLGAAFQDAFVRMLPVIRDQMLPALARFGQTLVTQIIPALANLASFIVANVVPVLVDFYAHYITALVAAIAGMADFITGTVIPAVQAFATFFQANILPVIQSVSSAIMSVAVPAFQAIASFVMEQVIPAVTQFANFITSNVGPVIQTMVGWFQSDVMPVLTQFAGFINQTVIPTLRAFGDFLNTFVLPIVKDVIGFIAQNWPHIRDTIESVMNAVVLVIQTQWNAIHAAIDAALTLIKAAVKLAWDLISTTIDNTLNTIKGLLDIFVGLFTGDWQRAWDGVKAIATSMWDEIKEVIRVAIEAVHTVLTTTLGLIEKTITTAWNLVKGIFSDAWNAAGGIVEIVGTGLNDIWNGIKGKLDDIRDNVVTPIWNGIKKIFEDGKTDIKNAIFWPFEQARDAIGGIMESFKNNMKGPWNTAADGINGFIKGVAGAINWVGEKLHVGTVIDLGGIISVPKFARGGITPGTPFIAGEEGPELIAGVPAGMQVFTADQTAAMLGRGGPWDWAKDKVSGVTSAVADEVRGWIAKGAKALLEAALAAAGLADLTHLGGALGGLGGGIMSVVKDTAVKAIQTVMDTIKDSVPQPSPVPGGSAEPDPNYPGGNRILDMAHQTAGAYNWCEKFVGDVMQRLGYRYARARDALQHSYMQPLSPGYGPDGSIVFWQFGPAGHVAFSQSGGFYGTVPGGTGWMHAGTYGPPAGHTQNPARGGAVFDEPMWGIGASGARWSMAEDDAEILLNKGQAARAANALRGGGDVIFQAGSVVIQGVRNLDDITDAQLERFMGRAAKVARRNQVLSGGSTM